MGRNVRRQSWGLMLALTAALAFVAPATPTSAAEMPASHILDGMPAYAQRWNLTCEYAATSAATLFYGQQISESTFINDIGFDANPNRGFRGSLNGGWGGIYDYGIYPRPILSVLEKRGFAHSYIFRSDPVLLKYELANNHPVVIWIVGTWGNAPRYQEESGGESYTLVPYEHVITAYGYDDTGVYIMDVAHGSKYQVSWATFNNAWSNLDGMALVVAM